MKKLISLLLVIATLFAFSVPVLAVEPTKEKIHETTEVEYLEDGSYITTTLIVKDEGVALASSEYTKTAYKTVTNHSDDGELMWKYDLEATFIINEGVSVICLQSDYHESTPGRYWSFSDGNSYIVNNIAHGLGTFKKKVLLVTVATHNVGITIQCDINGNFT